MKWMVSSFGETYHLHPELVGAHIETTPLEDADHFDPEGSRARVGIVAVFDAGRH